jgi:hypothetical protein
MGGGYISCGKWHGDDKSGSAIEGVFSALKPKFSADTAAHFARVWAKADEGFQQGEQEFAIPVELAAKLIPPLQDYYAELGEKMGHPDPQEAPELDRDSGLDMGDAKWGAGDGWRYYCAHDLLEACRLAVKSVTPVVVSFD